MKKATISSWLLLAIWCPFAESNYEQILTMDPLYHLTKGAGFP